MENTEENISNDLNLILLFCKILDIPSDEAYKLPAFVVIVAKNITKAASHPRPKVTVVELGSASSGLY